MTKFGGKSVEQLDEAIYQFYDQEKEKQHGVVGIEFALLDTWD